jgi:enoyl-CoA hydratase
MALWHIQSDDHGVYTLTIQNPPVNAMSMAAVAELRTHLDALHGQTGSTRVRVLIITGDGEKAFVAGANIKEINALADLSAAKAFGEGMLDIGNLIRTLPFPVIAAVNGVAYGGGCELAMMCDLRVASTSARLALPEITLGLMPGWGGSVRVARRAGASTAMLMALTGDPINADDALRLGLVDKVVAPDQLQSATLALATRMASMSADVIATIKRTIWHGLDMSLEAALINEMQTFARVVTDPDAKEGTDAFINKRPAMWSDR